MVFKLVQSTEKKWMKIKGFDQLKNIIEGINFVGEIIQNEEQNKTVRYVN